MPKPSPDPANDPLLGANAYRKGAGPSKAGRTPTRKERVVVPPAPQRKIERTRTVMETVIPDPAAEAPPSFRPRQRPPMALLTIYDDGRRDGETVRLRADSSVLGREHGEVVIPHDSRMSSRHAEIRRALENGEWKWTLSDLGSTNGTFVRVHKCSIKAGQELLIGHRRFRFEDAQPEEPPPAEPTGPRATLSWMPPMAILVELTSQGDGRRFPLPGNEHWVGGDASCTVPLDDPMIADRHVRLFRDERGWRLESHEARDGVWLRIEKPVTVDRRCSFQLGEQRFLLRVL
jgi:pSer/pThr/pTyr-binding forkhead associated (FHA) protein